MTDAEIGAARAEVKRAAELEMKNRVEKERIEEELRLMTVEDVPAMDQKEIEEI